MIRGLIEIAHEYDSLPGECYTVHILDGQIDLEYLQPVSEFMDRWEGEIDGVTCEDRIRCMQTPWLAVLHDDGELLVPLDPVALRGVPPVPDDIGEVSNLNNPRKE